jgi:hypothetical protein
MSADEDLSSWFDHLNQLLGCVGNVRTGLPADLPQFFCTALPAEPPFSELEKNTIRNCMSDTPVMPSLDDFAQAATFGALIDRRAPLKPRILEVMKKKAIEDGNCAAGATTAAFGAEKTTVSFPSPENRGGISRRLRLLSRDVLPVPLTWGSGLATANKTNDQAADEAKQC